MQDTLNELNAITASLSSVVSSVSAPRRTSCLIGQDITRQYGHVMAQDVHLMVEKSVFQLSAWNWDSLENLEIALKTVYKKHSYYMDEPDDLVKNEIETVHHHCDSYVIL